jgi:thiamine biosynthesis lipoprotein
VVRVEQVMGMPITVEVRDPDLAPRQSASAIDDCVAWFHQVDAVFSTYKVDSEINRLARRELAFADCSEDVRHVLCRCEELRIETAGYFDVMATGRLDPSGLVKGWAVGRGSAMLHEAGSKHHCINAGGDVVLAGEPEPGRLWHIGIDHPLVHRAVCAVVAVTDAAIATSGTSARGWHVINPHTGRAANELASVTVIGGDLETADAYATAALAMGLDAPRWLSSIAGYDALVVDTLGHIWVTESFPRYLVDISGSRKNRSFEPVPE